MSASAAGRQLQAILDQLSGGHGDAASHISSAHTAGQHSDKLPRTARAKHKQLPQRGSLFPCLCVCVCVCAPLQASVLSMIKSVATARFKV